MTTGQITIFTVVAAIFVSAIIGLSIVVSRNTAKVNRCRLINQGKKDGEDCVICSDIDSGVIVDGVCYRLPEYFQYRLGTHFQRNGKFYVIVGNTNNPENEEAREHFVESFVNYMKSKTVQS